GRGGPGLPRRDGPALPGDDARRGSRAAGGGREGRDRGHGRSSTQVIRLPHLVAGPSPRTPMPSAHTDTFARDHLPPRDLWPDLLIPPGSVFDYPARLNCAVELLDRLVEAGHGERVLFHTDEGTQTYAEFLGEVNRIAHVLRDMGVVPG